MKPRFEHDCERCTFLGRIEHTTGIHPDFMPSDEDWSRVFELGTTKHVDLYYCVQGAGHVVSMPTVIARYSNDGPDYVSGLHAVAHNTDLQIAKRMAIAKGLLPR